MRRKVCFQYQINIIYDLFQTNFVSDFPTKQLINDGHAINRYLKARHVPLEHDAVRFQRKKCEKEVLERFGAENMEQVGQWAKREIFNFILDK